MTHPTSVFDEIIKGENGLTQLLRNMLRFKLFRRLFLEHLELGIESENWDKDGFDVQYHTETNGRPDLVMEGVNTMIFYEIKVYDTSLTANQPEGYYNELINANDFSRKILVLLAPRDYYAYNDYNVRLSNVIKDRTNILTKNIYWEDVADIISKNEIGNTSPIFDEFYKFLYGWFKLQIILTQEDMNIIFNKQFPASLTKLTELIDEIKADFQKLGYQLKFKGSSRWEEYGYYFITTDESTIFFGIWFDYWEKFGEPFCITMEEPTEDSKIRFDTAIKKIGMKPVVEFEECPTSHFDRSILELPESRKKIVEMIRVIVDEVGVVKTVDLNS